MRGAMPVTGTSVFVYARYSSIEQDASSTAAQAANCRLLAEREGLHVTEVFSDEALTGHDDARPQFVRMLAALKRGGVAGVLADETSRLSRSPPTLLKLVAELKFNDQFLLTADGTDSRAEHSELLLSLRASIDQMEGRRTAHRVFRSMKEQHAQGRSTGGKCFGYASASDGEHRKRVVVEDQAKIVVEVFERYARGESAKSIARDLNARRVPSPGSFWQRPRANGWTGTTLTGSHSKGGGLLRNPIFKGDYTWNRARGKKRPGTGRRVQKLRPASDWVVRHDESLRIVADELWARVAKRLEDARRSVSAKGGKPARCLLSGVLKCACCSASYVMRNSTRYACSSANNGRAPLCTQRRQINRRKTEQRLLEGVRAKLQSPALVRDMARRVQARLRALKQPDRGRHSTELARIEREVGNVVAGISKLGGSAALLTRLRELEAEKARLTSEIAVVAAPPTIVPNVEQIIRRRIRELDQIPRDPHGDEETRENARASVRALLGGEVTVTEQGAHVYATVDLGRVCITDGAGGGT